MPHALVVGLLSFSAPAWCDVDARTARDEAISLMRAGKCPEAYALIVRSYGSTPEDASATFVLGQCAYALGRPQEAIERYRAILVREPDLPRVRAELGKAYLASGQPQAAHREFNAALAANPPRHVRDDLLALIAQTERPTTWTARASLGYLHDSNVNVGPSTSTVTIYGVPFDLTPESQPQSDSGTRAALAANHLAVLSNTHVWQSDLALEITDYATANRFDYVQSTITSGPKWRSGATLVSAPLLIEYAQLGRAKYFDTYGIAPQIDRVLDGGASVRGAALVQRRTFSDTSRTGTTWAAAVSLRKNVFRVDDYVEFAYRHTAENTRLTFLDNRADALGVTLGTPDWGGFSVELESAVSRIRYVEREAIFDAARRDTRTSLTASVGRRWLRNTLTIAASHAFTHNQSNIALNQYTRRVTMLQMAHVF